jgi:hypothetical protein
VLQKSQKTLRRIFDQKTKQVKIADQCSLKPATGIACEFVALRCSPPRYYSIAAPTVREFVSHAAKRLLQHYRPEAGIGLAVRNALGKRGPLVQDRYVEADR